MTTALYRRYRPETFGQVIGQSHVTEPLKQALRSHRVNHAYLFSGPRGCGKTTSARLLAKALNCARWEQGPDGSWPDEPCGQCDSCRELATGGPGSLDVVEIDAASHNGVDDARELRERAAYAPARDRCKVFIIDEAHMVTTAGFNALLKIVEEPPEHVRFIFATTEPNKVIGTIRSRTHHYPFHLVPAEQLQAYLAQLCVQENVAVGEGVLPLVARAGAGSVRDSLSVLDQLMAGAGPQGVDYERAVALLGYTHASLLDEAIGSLSSHDGAGAFAVVEQVLNSGHDPRRFVEDLLERFRDLIIILATGDGAAKVLRGLPDDQLNRMNLQATGYGASALSRAADITNTALTEMVGATSPRLHLELLIARLLLPGSQAAAGSALSDRLDRLERTILTSAATTPSPGPVAQTPARPTQPDVVRPSTRDSEPVASAAVSIGAPTPKIDTSPAQPQQAPVAPSAPTPAGSASAASVVQPVEPIPPPNTTQQQAPEPSEPGEPYAQHAPASSASDDRALMNKLRQLWPDIVKAVKNMRRATWSALLHAEVHSVRTGTVYLSFSEEGARNWLMKEEHLRLVRQAISHVTGEQLDVASSGSSEPELHPTHQAPAVNVVEQAAQSWNNPTAQQNKPVPAEEPPPVSHPGNNQPVDTRRHDSRPVSVPHSATPNGSGDVRLKQHARPDASPSSSRSEQHMSPTQPGHWSAATTHQPDHAQPSPTELTHQHWSVPGQSAPSWRERANTLDKPSNDSEPDEPSMDDDTIDQGMESGTEVVKRILGGEIIEVVEDR